MYIYITTTRKKNSLHLLSPSSASGSHLNSLKVGFCPHQHNETSLFWKRSKFSYLPYSINFSSH